MRNWWPPGRLTLMSTPQNHCRQCLCPCSEPQPLLPPLETLHYWQVGLAQSLLRSLLFSLSPGAHETLCVPSKSGISVSPVLWNSCDQTGLQSQVLWGLLLLLPETQAVDADVGFSLLWENFCGIIIFQFVSHPPGRYGI